MRRIVPDLAITDMVVFQRPESLGGALAGGNHLEYLDDGSAAGLHRPVLLLHCPAVQGQVLRCDSAEFTQEDCICQ